MYSSSISSKPWLWPVAVEFKDAHDSVSAALGTFPTRDGCCKQKSMSLKKYTHAEPIFLREREAEICRFSNAKLSNQLGSRMQW